MREKLIQYSILSSILFLFWVIFSGKLDVKHLMIGAVTALVIAWICSSFLQVSSVTTPGIPVKEYAVFNLPYLKLFPYLGWLLWELVKANVDVALLVLNPQMPISPQIFTFKKTMSNPVAHMILANSITLTPGTITVDVQEDVYTIHALTESAALSLAPLAGEGDMPARVGRLFNE